jgi:hypothetical protein
MSLLAHETILANNFYYKPRNNLRDKWKSVMPTATTLAVLVMLTRRNFWLANPSSRKFASSFTIGTLNRSFQIRCTTFESQNLSTVITQCMKNNIFVESGITRWWPCEKFRYPSIWRVITTDQLELSTCNLHKSTVYPTNIVCYSRRYSTTSVGTLGCVQYAKWQPTAVR